MRRRGGESTTSAAACAWGWARAGRVLHLPRHQDPARSSRSTRSRRTRRCATPPGALEGRLADPGRRPAPPGAARRLDLPGAARRGAPALVMGASPGWAAPSYDVLVIGAGLAGLTAATRLAEGGARVMVLAGRRRDAPRARHHRRARLCGRGPGRAPGDALGALDDAHPYARVGADQIAASVEWFRPLRRRAVGRVSLRGQPDRERAAADDGRRGEAVRRRARDDGGGRPAPGRPDARRRLPRAARLPRRLSGRQRLARACRRARSSSTTASTGGPRPTASVSSLPFGNPGTRAEIAADVGRALDGTARVGFGRPGDRGSPRRVERPPGAARAPGVRSPTTLPPSVPGMRVFRTCATACARTAGG